MASLLTALGQAVAAYAHYHVEFITTPHSDWTTARVFLLPWAVQFFCSWTAFLIYMRIE